MITTVVREEPRVPEVQSQPARSWDSARRRSSASRKHTQSPKPTPAREVSDYDGPLLISQLGPVTFSVPATDVERVVLPPDHITPIPTASAEVLGLFSHGSQISLAMSTHRMLGLAEPEDPRRGYFIMTRNGTERISFRIDDIVGLTESNGLRRVPLPPHAPLSVFDSVLFYERQLVLTTDVRRLSAGMPHKARARKQIVTTLLIDAAEAMRDAAPEDPTTEPKRKTPEPVSTTPRRAGAVGLERDDQVSAYRTKAKRIDPMPVEIRPALVAASNAAPTSPLVAVGSRDTSPSVSLAPFQPRLAAVSPAPTTSIAAQPWPVEETSYEVVVATTRLAGRRAAATGLALISGVAGVLALLRNPKPHVDAFLPYAAPLVAGYVRSTAAASGPFGEPRRVFLYEESGELVYRVRPGDTLWDIAEGLLGDPFLYPLVAGLSNISNPHLIRPGQLVRMQVPEGWAPPTMPNQPGSIVVVVPR